MPSATTSEGADELIYIDIVASLYGRNSLMRRWWSEPPPRSSCPSPWAGGVRTLEDVTSSCGRGPTRWRSTPPRSAGPSSSREASARLRVPVHGAVRRGQATAQRAAGRPTPTTAGRRTGLDVVDWVRRAVDLGAGRGAAHLGGPGGHPARVRPGAARARWPPVQRPGDRLRRARAAVDDVAAGLRGPAPTPWRWPACSTHGSADARARQGRAGASRDYEVRL